MLVTALSHISIQLIHYKEKKKNERIKFIN